MKSEEERLQEEVMRLQKEVEDRDKDIKRLNETLKGSGEFIHTFVKRQIAGEIKLANCFCEACFCKRELDGN